MNRMMRVSVLGFGGKGWLVVALAFVFAGCSGDGNHDQNPSTGRSGVLEEVTEPDEGQNPGLSDVQDGDIADVEIADVDDVETSEDIAPDDHVDEVEPPDDGDDDSDVVCTGEPIEGCPCTKPGQQCCVHLGDGLVCDLDYPMGSTNYVWHQFFDCPCMEDPEGCRGEPFPQMCWELPVEPMEGEQ